MKSISWLPLSNFRVLRSRSLAIVAILLGGTMVALAGPCYVNQTALANSVGCPRDTTIGPSGTQCPSDPQPLPAGSCSYNVIANTVRTGANGNQPSGLQSVTEGADVCYSYQSCVVRGFPDVPAKWFCQVSTTTPLSNTWSAQQASGGACTNSGG
jgi:hypothetical protein